MIYKDAKASGDTDSSPANRGERELCVRCGYNYGRHNGWRCPGGSGGATFNTAPYAYRYLTKGMKDSIQATSNPCLDVMVATSVSSPTPTVDVSDWRAWAKKRSGECACGIPRERCDYHK